MKKFSLIKRFFHQLRFLLRESIGILQVIDMRIYYKQRHRKTFAKLENLEIIYENANGASILDIGTDDGLISYELARHGAKIIHGIDKSWDSIGFCRRLFKIVPCESKFMYLDLTKGINKNELLDGYDIILFFNVYYWLKQKMSNKDLDKLLHGLLRKTKKWFVVRSPQDQDAIEQLALSQGFVLRCKDETPWRTHIYERVKRIN